LPSLTGRGETHTRTSTSVFPGLPAFVRHWAHPAIVALSTGVGSSNPCRSRWATRSGGARRMPRRAYVVVENRKPHQRRCAGGARSPESSRLAASSEVDARPHAHPRVHARAKRDCARLSLDHADW